MQARRRERRKLLGTLQLCIGSKCCQLEVNGTSAAAAAAADLSTSRPARQRPLQWGLNTACMEAWAGSTMFACAAHPLAHGSSGTQQMAAFLAAAVTCPTANLWR